MPVKNLLTYSAAFVSGAILMGLEMLGSRVLAPFFGTSIFVWGGLIGVVLVALSVGYYAGGRLADRYPEKGPLALIFALTGTWTAFLPVMARVSLPVVAASFDTRSGSVFAAFLLFFFPGTLLAMVSPWCLRLSISSVEASGRVSGLLYAISNLGSIAGTFLTSFYLIPQASADRILRWFSVSLAFLAVAVVLSARKRTLSLIVSLFTLVSIIAGLQSYPIYPWHGIIYETQSLYHHIFVEDRGRQRLLRFDDSIQGGMFRDDPYESSYPYADYFHLALCFNDNIRDVLMIGLGAGLVPKRFYRDYPEMYLDVAEIDEKVEEVARKYFGLPESERLKVYVKDGRIYLKETSKRYDLIMVDAYYADSIPFHLATVEFYELVRERLNPGGVVACNIIGALSGPNSKLFRSMYFTFARVFPANFVFPVDYSEDSEYFYRNIIVFGVKTGDRGATGNVGGTGQSDATGELVPAEALSRDEIIKRAEALSREKVTIKRFPEIARNLYQRQIDPEDVVLLTDEYAPVDALLHLY